MRRGGGIAARPACSASRKLAIRLEKLGYVLYNLSLIWFLDGNNFPEDLFASIVVSNNIAGKSDLLGLERREGMHNLRRNYGGNRVQL